MKPLYAFTNLTTGGTTIRATADDARDLMRRIADVTDRDPDTTEDTTIAFPVLIADDTPITDDTLAAVAAQINTLDLERTSADKLPPLMFVAGADPDDGYKLADTTALLDPALGTDLASRVPHVII